MAPRFDRRSLVRFGLGSAALALPIVPVLPVLAATVAADAQSTDDEDRLDDADIPPDVAGFDGVFSGVAWRLNDRGEREAVEVNIVFRGGVYAAPEARYQGSGWVECLSPVTRRGISDFWDGPVARDFSEMLLSREWKMWDEPTPRTERQQDEHETAYVAALALRRSIDRAA